MSVPDRAAAGGRSSGSATPSRTGTLRTGVHRTGTLRTGTHRTGTHRTGAVRNGSLRAGSAASSTRAGGAQRSVPVRPDLRLVPPFAPARGRGRRRAPFVLLVVGLLIGTTLGLLVLNTAVAVDSLKATALRKENARRVEEVQRLQRQVVEGSTPQQLAARASAAGLVPAGSPGYLVVQPDGTATLRGKPSPAPAPPPAPPTPTPSPAAPSPAGTPPSPAVPPPAGTVPSPVPAPVPDAAGD